MRCKWIALWKESGLLLKWADRALKCHCRQGVRQGCSDVLACVTRSRHRALCRIWGRCFGAGLLLLCNHGSRPLYPGQTTLNSPYLQHPHEHSWGQPAGAAMCCHREAANREDRGAFGSLLCYKLLADKPRTAKRNKIQKGWTCLLLVRDSCRL